MACYIYYPNLNYIMRIAVIQEYKKKNFLYIQKGTPVYGIPFHVCHAF